MKKIIIIGAGIAGLTAAVYARKNGFAVDVYELHKQPGGECTGWQRGDYHFDNCIHWLVGSKPGTGFYKIWHATGALDENIDIALHDEFFSYNYLGKTLHIYRDVNRLESHLLELAPEDETPIRAFCNSIRVMMKFDAPVEKPRDMMTAIDGIKLAFSSMPVLKELRKGEKTTLADYVKQFSSPILRKGLVMMIPPEYSVFALLMTLGSYASGDSGYPMGGSLAFAQRMESQARNLGTVFHYGARVEKIIVENDTATGIRLSDGSEARADFVISAADGYATIYKMLDGKYINDKVHALYHDPVKYQVMDSTVDFHLGINADLSARPHMNIIHLDQPLELGDGSKVHDLGLQHYCHDATLAPAGKSIISVFINTNFDWWKAKSTDRKAYLAEKKRLADEVTSLVEEMYPETAGMIEVTDVATPVTYERYCNAWQGAWMSFKTNPQMEFSSLDGFLPGLKNFIMGGMWTQFPGGLPGAAMGGKYAVMYLCRQEKMKFIHN